MLTALIVLIATFASIASAYKILILFPTASYSHQVPAMGLTESLVKKGHQVYVASPNVVPGLEKNYTHIDFPWAYKYFLEVTTNKNVNLQQILGKYDGIASFWGPYTEVTRKQYESDTFQQFYKRVKEERIDFDLVLVESLFIPYGCAIARLLTGNKPLPLVTLATLIGGDFYTESAIGNILHLSYYPSLLGSYSVDMNIWERIENWVSQHYISYQLKKTVEDSARDFMTDTYGPTAGALVDGCWANVSFSIISSNALYYYPRPVTPNVAEIGPLHIKTPGKLPQTIQEWLDGAEKGVVYFSLGSNMKSKTLQGAIISNFLKVFSQLPEGYRVLWKWEDDAKITGQSSNILTQKWMPQQSVLVHPKVKVFITQGGCQSFQETVHYGVPTVAIPWFADQEANVAKMVHAGIGVRLRPSELLSYEKVKSAIEAVLFDERYANSMKRLSEISHDFTSRSHDDAVFWIEHVAKHGGASHLRPSIADTTYFQFFCLDILSVILAIALAALYIIITAFRFLILHFSPSNKRKIKNN